MPLQNPVFDPRSLYTLSQSDVAKRLDPDNKVAVIAEVLSQTNEILTDMPFVEANLPTGHRVTVRTGLPKAYWRRMNQGIPSSASSVAQVEETCGTCEARSRIDVDAVNLNGQSAAFRASEDRAFIEAMNVTMTETLFYGDARRTGDGFVGFAPRYNTTDTKKADCAKNVIDCGGQDGRKLTSIWMIGWGTDTVFGIYPKDTPIGLQSEDKGIVTVNDENGYPYDAYETVYRWRNGLVVKDWRYVVRLCNIDIEEVMAGAGLGVGDISQPNSNNLILQMNNALYKFPAQGSANICIYMNSDMHAALNNVASRSNTNVITIEQGLNAFGRHATWTSYLGHPMRRVDAIKNNEKQVK